MYPGEGAFALIMGIICGYPTGAKIVANLYTRNIITLEEAERLLSFTNNSGPLFIVASVGIGMFCDTRTGILLLLTHILASLCVGFCFRFWKNKPNEYISRFSNTNKYNLSPKIEENLSTGELFSNAVSNSIHTILMIGGFIVIFSVLSSILEKSHIFDIIYIFVKPIFSLFGINEKFIYGIINGILEVTNGSKIISSVRVQLISMNITICSFLLGFGGMCVLLQVFSVISKTGLSIKPYFIGKIMHGVFSAIFTWFCLKYIPYFNLDIVPTFANFKFHYVETGNFIFGILILLIGILAIARKRNA